MGTAANNTFFLLDNHFIQAGVDDPSSVAVEGRAGSIYIQVPIYPATTPIAVWQKLDNGVTTNWIPFGNGNAYITDYKDPVNAVSTGDVNIASAPASIDTVVLSPGDRVLLKDQALPEENGIYDFNGAGNPLTRSPDADTDAEVTQGMFTFTLDGDVNLDTGWLLVTPNPISLGVTPLSFVELTLGVTDVAPIDSFGPSANGAVVIANQIAFSSQPQLGAALLVPSAQQIVGEKTFSDPVSGTTQGGVPAPAASGDAKLYVDDIDRGSPDPNTAVWYQQDNAGNERILNGIIQESAVEKVRAPQFLNFIGVTVTPNGLGADLQVFASGVSYTPTTPANWPIVPANVQQALDNLAASVSGLSISLENVRYVAKNGSDITGTGAINKPYLTVQAAMASITDATNLKRYVIMVQPGRYSETNLKLKANVFVVGLGDYFYPTRIQNNVAIDLDPNFNVANDIRSGFDNINLASAVNLNFDTVLSNEGKVFFRNCQLASTLTMTAFSSINQVTVENCRTFGLITQNGVNAEYQDNYIIGGLTVNALSGKTTIVRAFGNSLAGNISHVGNGVDTLTAQYGGNSYEGGTFSAANGAVVVSADVTSLPPTQSITGGAVLNLVSRAQNVGYTPAVPADWSTPPNDVAEALDALAAVPAPSIPVAQRETFVITLADIANGYLQLAFAAVDNSVNPIIQGAAPLIGGSIAGGDDYELSLVVTTRVTFSPAIVAAWTVGQRVQIQYLK